MISFSLASRMACLVTERMASWGQIPKVKTAGLRASPRAGVLSSKGLTLGPREAPVLPGGPAHPAAVAEALDLLHAELVGKQDGGSVPCGGGGSEAPRAECSGCGLVGALPLRASHTHTHSLGRGSRGASPLLPRSARVRKKTCVSRTVHDRRPALLWPGRRAVPTSWVPVTSLSLRTCPPAHSPPPRLLQPQGPRDDSRGALRSTGPFSQTLVCHSSVLGHSMFTAKEDGAGGRGGVWRCSRGVTHFR